ncbi:cytochrome P450 [Mycobacterium sp. GA-2829]|uniref:cytochrome P450 n=1 Tax=Mycobacterium sp. GA-2829 TaxID=1772283 RepID=UPI00073FB663|nr:cytochrome P450 [Mycobacterium sp. GA-2829]KUI29323.1 steroid C27-monooxygenase [Mycobacterium sp. GA-2829]
MSTTGECPFNAGFDLTDPAVHAEGMPLKEYAELRRTAPVWWNAQNPGTGGYHDGGFWVVTKYDDVKAVSRDSELWSSYINTSIPRLPEDITPEQVGLTKIMMLNQDAPSHTRLRRLISRLFTPRAVAAMEDRLRDTAYRIVHAAAEKDCGNFVDDVAAKLPMEAIGDLIGVPPGDREKVLSWTNSMLNSEDPDADDPREASAQLLGYAYQWAEDRRKNPADDIVTRLVTDDERGEALDETEFGFFVMLLATAGGETTRNAITFGMAQLLTDRAQWELFKSERPATAVDEVIRWSTPVQCFQRTATRDTEINGVPIAAGQRITIYYGSANFDEDVSTDPHRFDILRNPNPHVSFGGSGAHYCIGANLARMEVGLMLNAIADVLPDIEMTGDLELVRSGWIHGAKNLPVRYHARSRHARATA